jgi:LysR family transcriptional activator of nhaA
MNYRHLYYFWRVASEGNLTKVARSIPVSQSALSSQIQQLEEWSGTQLFEREGRRLNLTDMGRQVMAYANEIFSTGEELESLLRSGEQPEKQLLRVGMLTTLSRNFIDGLLQPLRDDSKVSFSLQADNIQGLLDGLTKHQLDVALTDSDIKGSDEQIWQSRLLARQPVAIVGSPELQLTKKFPQGYEQMRWVVPTREHEIRRAFEGYCSQHQFDPDIKAEANDMAMLRLLARNSGALAVLPTVVVRDELSQGILKIWQKLPNTFGDFYAITVRRIYEPAALHKLFEVYE